jgi:hypothetical protein
VKGAITCGSFHAVPVDDKTWDVGCDHLPDWRETVTASEDTIARVVIKLQAEFRDSWRSSK